MRRAFPHGPVLTNGRTCMVLISLLPARCSSISSPMPGSIFAVSATISCLRRTATTSRTHAAQPMCSANMPYATRAVSWAMGSTTGAYRLMMVPGGSQQRVAGRRQAFYGYAAIKLIPHWNFFLNPPAPNTASQSLLLSLKQYCLVSENIDNEHGA